MRAKKWLLRVHFPQLNGLCGAGVSGVNPSQPLKTERLKGSSELLLTMANLVRRQKWGRSADQVESGLSLILYAQARTAFKP